MLIRDCQESDLPEILAIFNDAILHTTAAWTYEPVSLDFVADVFRTKRDDGFPYLVSISETGIVLGYASVGPFRDAEACAQTVENSVYVAKEARGRGVAKQLMQRLIAETRKAGFRSIIAAIGGDNEASIKLHRQLGFEFCGSLPEMGYKFDQWLTLELYQLMLMHPKC